MDFNFEIVDRGPLEEMLAEIERATDAGFHYLAISVALALPDICSSLEADLGQKPWKGVEERYTAWAKTYVEPKYRNFTAEDCWALRGGVIHQGKSFGHPNARYDRVLFGLRWNGNLIHDSPMGNCLMLDAKMFVESMTKATRDWSAAKKDDEMVVKNLPGLVRKRLEGFAPGGIHGWPLIA